MSIIDNILRTASADTNTKYLTFLKKPNAHAQALSTRLDIFKNTRICKILIHQLTGSQTYKNTFTYK